MLIPNPGFRPRSVDLPAGARAVPLAARPAPVPGVEAGVSLPELLATLRAALPWCLLAAVLLAAAGAWLGTILPRSYTAEGLLTIDTQRVAIPEFQTIRSERTVEPWGSRSEAKVLSSRVLLERAARAVELDRHPAFAPRPPLRLRLAREPWMPAPLAGWLEAAAEPGAEAPEAAMGAVIDRVARKLRVVAETQSYAIEVSFTAPDPVLAADFVNALMRAYVDNELAARREATVQASRQLGQRVEQLRADLQATRAQIRALEARGETVEASGGTVSSQALLALHRERLDAQSARQAVQADLDQITAAMAAGRFNVLNDTLVTPRLRTLWENEAVLQRHIADSAVQFGPRHPRMIALQQELAGLRAQIQAEVQGVRRDLERKIASLQNRERTIAAQIEAAERQAASSAVGRAGLKELLAEAESKQALYNVYRERYEQTLASLEFAASDARIVSPASVPHQPSSPGPTLLGVVGALLGLVGGSGIAVARRYFRRGVEDVEEIPALTGAPALGGVPEVRAAPFRAANLAAQVLARPTGDLAETLRGILVRLLNGETGARALVVTSARPGDGKSSFVAAAARVAAQDGLRVLALDCDLRRPSLARLIGTDAFTPIDALLAGRCDLEEAIVPDRSTGAHFVFARPLRDVHRQMLEGRRMTAVLSTAKARYDLVILDTPPVLSVVDPILLGRLVDGTVVTVRWRTVERRLVQAAVRRLEESGCGIVGVVLNALGNSRGTGYVYEGY